MKYFQLATFTVRFSPNSEFTKKSAWRNLHPAARFDQEPNVQTLIPHAVVVAVLACTLKNSRMVRNLVDFATLRVR